MEMLGNIAGTDLMVILIAWIVAIGVSAAATPLVAWAALVMGVVDRPNERKVSKRANMPLLGGVAVALGFYVSMAVALVMVDQNALTQLEVGGHINGLFFGGLLLLVVGAWDDKGNMRPVVKLAAQGIAAWIAIAYGYKITYFTDPFLGEVWFFPTWLTWVISTLWIVGITNAINLIDGLDGLATGVSAIITLTLIVIALQMEQVGTILLGIPLLGALLGFLPFNFPPARVFLGDTGALFIGFTLSLTCLEGYRQITVLTFIVPLLVLAVPILDTSLSVLRRVRKRMHVFSADRAHIHHRMLDVHGSHRAAVLSIYFLTACFCVIAISLMRLKGVVAVVFLMAVALLTLRLLVNLRFFEMEPDRHEKVLNPIVSKEEGGAATHTVTSAAQQGESTSVKDAQ